MARVCQDCPRIIPTGTKSGRCLEHQRAYERARGTSTQRGYGTAHKNLRRWWIAQQAAGVTLTCWRCGRPIVGPFDLGHDDIDRTRYRGPEHPACNRATAARRAPL